MTTLTQTRRRGKIRLPAGDAATGPRRRPWSLRKALVYFALGVFIVVTVAPFLYLISVSLKRGLALFTYPPQVLPNPITLSNYSRLFTQTDFLRWTANTIGIGLVVTVLTVAIDSLAAYALTAMEFDGRRVVLGAIIATVMVPAPVLLLPLFFTARDLGLLNTYWVLILPQLANPIGPIILWGFMTSLPRDLLRAARVDNCGDLRTYWFVVLPLVRPALVVVGVFSFVTSYTMLIWPLVAAPNIPLVTTGLAMLRPGVGTPPDWPLISAGSVMAMVPLLLFFLAFQRQFIGTSLSGAFKG